MLFIGRVRVRELWRLIALVVVVMAAAVTVMYMFNIGRSHTWVNRLGLGDALSKTEQVQVQNDEDNLQEEQAQIAIASGGITGKGPGNSTQRSNLPHAYSDFAYAFIVEEYGLVGSCLILFLYLCVFFPGNRNLPAVRNGAAEPAGFGPQPDDHVAGADQYDGVGGLFSGDRADVAADQSRRFVCGIYEFVVGDYPRREPPDEKSSRSTAPKASPCWSRGAAKGPENRSRYRDLENRWFVAGKALNREAGKESVKGQNKQGYLHRDI